MCAIQKLASSLERLLFRFLIQIRSKCIEFVSYLFRSTSFQVPLFLGKRDSRNEVVVNCRRGLMVPVDGALMSFENLFCITRGGSIPKKKMYASNNWCDNGRLF